MHPRAAAVVGLGLAAVTTLVGLDGAEAASPIRHLYAIPVVAAALRFGLPGGALAGLTAVSLHAPIVFRQVERAGLDRTAAEGLITFGVLLATGTLSGALVTRGRRQRRRYLTLREVQRALYDGADLETALERLQAVLVARLPASAIALVAAEGDGVIVAGGTMKPGSLALEVMKTRVAAFLHDGGGDRRPRRVFVAPLGAADAPPGVLVVERAGDFGREERAEIQSLAVHLGLALENARLTCRQRRFTEELEDKVKSATRRLEEVDQAKSTFVAVASHELRTPLTALAGFAELLATRAFPAGEVQRLAEIMHRETGRLARIVDDLLDLSRIERGLAPTFSRVAVPVEPAIAAACRLFRHAGARHDVVIDSAADVAAVAADPDALERILTNLLSNAVKYAPPGSTIWVRASEVEGEDHVRFEVEDQGPGIPRAALPHVFEPYYRAPGAASVATGAGLGLAVVRALVEGQGGRITIESSAGSGTRVALTLPIFHAT